MRALLFLHARSETARCCIPPAWPSFFLSVLVELLESIRFPSTGRDTLPLTSQKLFEDIIMYLSVLRYIIKSRTKKGLYDLNKRSEPFFRDLLNDIYGWDLQNLNLIQTNYPAIDLGDAAQKVCVQVTAQSDSAKIQGTIKKFLGRNLYNEYDRLVILVITDKKSYTFQSNTEGKFVFEAQRDILDIDDLLAAIEPLPPSSIAGIHAFLQRELSTLVSLFADRSSLLGQAEVKIELPPSNAKKFLDYLEYAPEEIEQGRKDVLSFYSVLTSLPKRTREYLFIFTTRGEARSGIGCDGVVISARALESFTRLSRKENTEEFRILQAKGIAEVTDEPGWEIGVSYRMDTGVDIIRALKEYCNNDERLRTLLVDCEFTRLDHD